MSATIKYTIVVALLGISMVAECAPSTTTCEYQAPVDSRVRPNKSVRLGAYFYAGKLDVGWYANNFDLLDLNAKNDPETVARLKQRNPEIKVFQQFLANQIAIQQSGAQAVEGYDATTMNPWLLRDTKGLVARSHRGPYYLMMDIAGTQGWASHFATYTAQVLQKTGADGIVLDEVPLSKNEPFVDLVAYPSEEALQNGTRVFLRSINTTLKRKVLINAGQLHKKRLDGTVLWRWMGDDIDGAWHEGWVRYYGAHDQPHSGEAWEWDIRSAEEFSAKDKPYIASAAFRDIGELEYGIANYLLAIRGRSLVFQPMLEYRPDTRGGFNAELVKQAVEQYRPLFDVELGCALRPREFREGVWVREFARGLVVVNPSRREIEFKGASHSFKDAFGKSIQLPIRIPAYGGRVLLNQAN